MGFELFLFVALGIVAISAAALMIISENAVYSALFLILNFGCVALLYLMLDAPFISMVQIAVYAGAIMVLFLFVIMLLGAEETTDTSQRRFGWMSTVATILVMSLLFAVVTPLLLAGGVDLPESTGENPQVRVVHAANIDVATVGIVNEEGVPLVIDGVRYGDVTPFIELEAGMYEITLLDDEENIAVSSTIELLPDAVISVIASGTADAVDADTEVLIEEDDEAVVEVVVDGETVEAVDIDTVAPDFSLIVLNHSIAPTNPGQGRFKVVNAYNGGDIILVDYGRNEALDLRDDGTFRDEILTEVIPYGETSPAIDFEDGEDYTFAFYAEQADELTEVTTLRDYDVVQGQETVLLLAPDYEAAPDLLGVYRPRVVGVNDGRLDVITANSFGSPADIGMLLFTDYLLPVNLVGFLLLVALIGVIVLTRPQGIETESRSVRNRRRKVSRPLVSVISQQTGEDVVVDTPRLSDPGAGND